MLRLNLKGYTEREVMEYILAGLQQRKRELIDTIAAIEDRIGKRPKAPSNGLREHLARPEAAPAKGPHRLSAEARERIAAAQRKRWRAARAKAKAKPARKRPRLQLAPEE